MVVMLPLKRKSRKALRRVEDGFEVTIRENTIHRDWSFCQSSRIVSYSSTRINHFRLGFAI